MKKIITTSFFAASVIAVFALAASAQHPSMFDEYGAVNTEDEMVRLDNFTIALQNSPVDTATSSSMADAKAALATLRRLSNAR